MSELHHHSHSHELDRSPSAGPESSAEDYSAEFEQLDAGGLSPLQRAVLAGDLNRMGQLLTQGADANRVVMSADGRVGTALLCAVTLSNPNTRFSAVSMLLDAGADPNRLADCEGNLPLRYLLENAAPGSSDELNDVVRLLLSRGAELDEELAGIAQEHSLFGIEYEYRRQHAVRRPVEEPARVGCCLVPLAVIVTIGLVILYVVGLYLGWWQGDLFSHFGS